MDLTKPILEICIRVPMSLNRVDYEPISLQLPTCLMPNCRQLRQINCQDRYQQLYQAYNERTTQLSETQDEADRYKQDNQRLQLQIQQLKAKNEQLNYSLISKNTQLEETYQRLQEEIKRAGNRNIQSSNQAIERLESGLREAIHSNFELLKETALSDIKYRT